MAMSPWRTRWLPIVLAVLLAEIMKSVPECIAAGWV